MITARGLAPRGASLGDCVGRGSFLPSGRELAVRRLCRPQGVLPQDCISCRGGGLGKRTQDSVQATQRGSPPPPAGLLSTGPARRCGGTRLTPAPLAAQSCRLDSRVAASSLSSAAQRSHVLSVHQEQGVPSEQEVCIGLAPRHSLPDCQDAPSKRFISCLVLSAGRAPGCRGWAEHRLSGHEGVGQEDGTCRGPVAAVPGMVPRARGPCVSGSPRARLLHLSP